MTEENKPCLSVPGWEEAEATIEPTLGCVDGQTSDKPGEASETKDARMTKNHNEALSEKTAAKTADRSSGCTPKADEALKPSSHSDHDDRTANDEQKKAPKVPQFKDQLYRNLHEIFPGIKKNLDQGLYQGGMKTAMESLTKVRGGNVRVTGPESTAFAMALAKAVMQKPAHINAGWPEGVKWVADSDSKGAATAENGDINKHKSDPKHVYSNVQVGKGLDEVSRSSGMKDE